MKDAFKNDAFLFSGTFSRSVGGLLSRPAAKPVDHLVMPYAAQDASPRNGCENTPCFLLVHQ